ncbi:neocarzinostatin apoprotein domain-containing protein [Actinoplanes sp. NBC_00393]|uniref:neocarzinostatin apoprotein domain-containing protein n=1 Tax=Actinoplanes sp. NBC_00393 TaxID=2975953 RepID=UPI002E1D9C33
MPRYPRIRRLAAAVAAGLVCAGAVVLMTGTPAAAAPTLTVSKTSGLKDGDTVTVSGNGFTASLTNIALGQCIKDPATSTDCNLAGGAVFVNADASGNTAQISLKLATSFGGHDCGTDGCVIAAQILPSAAEPEVVEANKAQVPITFGGGGGGPASPTPSKTTSPAATKTTPAGTTTSRSSTPAAGGALPKTGPGQEWATVVLIGSALMLPGIGLLMLLPARRRRMAGFR